MNILSLIGACAITSLCTIDSINLNNSIDYNNINNTNIEISDNYNNLKIDNYGDYSNFLIFYSKNSVVNEYDDNKNLSMYQSVSIVGEIAIYLNLNETVGYEITTYVLNNYSVFKSNNSYYLIFYSDFLENTNYSFLLIPLKNNLITSPVITDIYYYDVMYNDNDYTYIRRYIHDYRISLNNLVNDKNLQTFLYWGLYEISHVTKNVKTINPHVLLGQTDRAKEFNTVLYVNTGINYLFATDTIQGSYGWDFSNQQVSMIYNNLYFISNGLLFDTIIVKGYKAISLPNRLNRPIYSNVSINDKNNLIPLEWINNGQAYIFSELIFNNSITSLSVQVMTSHIDYYESYITYTDTNVWVSSNYYNITFIGDVSMTYLINGNISYDSWSYYSSLISIACPNASIIYDSTDSVFNVFTLLGTAFNSLIGIFNIQLFNGITLGMLISLPFVGLIIFFIVGLFKR